MIKLELKTGDVHTKEIVELCAIFPEYTGSIKDGEVDLTFCGKNRKIKTEDWLFISGRIEEGNALFQKCQNKKHEYYKESIADFVIDSTAVLQVFMAAFEISNKLHMIFVDPATIINLAENILSLPPYKRLFFPKTEWAQKQDDKLFDELLDNNRMGKIKIKGGKTLDSGVVYVYDNVYMPYSTPISWHTKISDGAKKLWNEIRYKKQGEI